MSQLEIPIFPADLMRLLGIKHAGTLLKQIKAGRIPEPDVRITQKTRYWHRSSLIKAKLIQGDPEGSASSPNPATSSDAPA